MLLLALKVRGLPIILWAAAALGCQPPEGAPEVLPDAAPAAQMPAPEWARASGTVAPGLAIRSEPAPGANQVGLIPEGCVATLTGNAEGGWHELRYDDVVGWSHGDNLEMMTKNIPSCVIVDNMLLLPWDEGEAFAVLEGNGDAGHQGVDQWAWDFDMEVGDPVLASRPGVVRLARGDSDRGGCEAEYSQDSNYLVIDHGDGTETLYLHLQQGSLNVAVGDPVERGQHIANSGDSGWTCEPMLHFQVQVSPDGGGEEGFYNQTVMARFYDTGAPLSLSKGDAPLSANLRP